MEEPIFKILAIKNSLCPSHPDSLHKEGKKTLSGTEVVPECDLAFADRSHDTGGQQVIQNGPGECETRSGPSVPGDDTPPSPSLITTPRQARGHDTHTYSEDESENLYENLHGGDFSRTAHEASS